AHSALTRQLGSSGLQYQSTCILTLANPTVMVTHALPVSGWSGDGYAFLRLQQGAGVVLVLGSEAALSNANLGGSNAGNRVFLSWLLPLWLPGLVEEELGSRKEKPQRHRLLHGYPMKPLLWPLAHTNRKLITDNFLELRSREDSGERYLPGSRPRP